MELEERFTQPPGWQWREKLETRSGQYVRYGWVVPQNPKAAIILLPGLSEYIEKYFETTRDLLTRGYAVAVIEWRGQGLSWRHLSDRTKRHNDDFSNDIADAYAVIDIVRKLPEFAPLTKIMLAHSMGGHIGLRFLHDYPDIFKAAVFSASMQGVPLPFDGQGFIRRVIDFVCELGWAEKYIPGARPWTEKFFGLGMMHLTSDKARANMQLHWMTHNPDLQPGGLTFGWLRAALRSTGVTLEKDFLEKITIPCLFSIAKNERIVSNRAIEKTVARMPHAESIRVDGALHEILTEKDVYRDQFWHAFDAFVAKHI